MSTKTWKLQDAKARFSELVREARKGEPQRVTVHGKDAVVVVDPTRFEVRRIDPQEEETLAGFFERSKNYRARNETEELVLPPRTETFVGPLPFEDFDKDDKRAS